MIYKYDIHMKKLNVLLLALIAGILPAWSQTAGKSMTVEDLVSWQRISKQKISNNGKWAACKMEPWKGDATVYLYGKDGMEAARFGAAGQFEFSASSSYIVVNQLPEVEKVEKLKLKKTKKSDMPMNSLIIYAMNGGREDIDSVRNYHLAQNADWIAYQRSRNDSTLFVRSLDGEKSFDFPSVDEYGFASKSAILYFLQSGKNDTDVKELYVFDPETGKSTLIKEGKGEFINIAFDEHGNNLALLYAEDENTAYKATELWLSKDLKKAELIVEAGNAALPEGWVVSQYGDLDFSKSSSRLFFGTSPEPKQVDTLILPENYPDVQVWSWDEPEEHTAQNLYKEEALQMSYEAVYSLNDGTVYQLATEELPELSLSNEGDGAYALLSGSEKYSVSSLWEGRSRSDNYLISLENGQRKLLSEADYAYYSFSPEGNYLYGYADMDSCWFTVSIPDGIRHQLTSPETFVGWDEENDIPDHPGPYGSAGWSEGDENFYIYDRYDIWKFDPDGIEKPVNMTVNGRENKITYRFVRLDREARSINPKDVQLLRGTDEVGKGDGYYSFSFAKPKAPKELIAGDFMLRTINKAKDADKVIFTKESYEMYPDVHYSDLSFKKPVQLTEGYKQEEGFIWGTAELVSWTSFDGQYLEGIVYKPANFDPNKKYPMIVNPYERDSKTLYDYHMPEAHRSTVDYRMYNSNGYIIFNPDIRYKDGHPGESCYNCLVPGVQMLIDRGYVDEKAIGAQGHSWGGYQVAYLVTRTNMFAAIEAGAPVVNMFSAYGGIRWGSGMARSFQYEHGQSRLGTDPWSGPEIYKENSPLFNMDKVQTPVLIMHNDNDGHVPWYQGIEYFVAMKRLEKPCWLLNYTGEIHWPMRLANRIDFQKRMMQFFDHYLKGEPMPKWMKEGRPAVDEPFDLGY